MATLNQTKLFHVVRTDQEHWTATAVPMVMAASAATNTDEMEVDEAVLGAQQLTFSPDSNKLLIATPDAHRRLLMVELPRPASTVNAYVPLAASVLFNETAQQARDNTASLESIRSLAVSADTQWVAIGDNHNHIHVIHLDTHKVSRVRLWMLTVY